MKQITESVYVETGYRMPNVGCILTEQGAVLVDSPFLPAEAKDWRSKVDRLTDKGVACIVNTDWHFDHILGNCFLSEKVIVHRRNWRGFLYYQDRANIINDIKMFFLEEVSQWEKELEAVLVPLPQVTFSDELDLRFREQTIQLKLVGGHTPGTIWIYYPEEKVLFTGDNIENKRHPAMGGAKFDAWLTLLREAEEMDVDYIVPGHGEIGDKSLATNYRKYFEDMQECLREFKSQGMDKETTSEKIADYLINSYVYPEAEVAGEFLRKVLKTGAGRMFDQTE